MRTDSHMTNGTGERNSLKKSWKTWGIIMHVPDLIYMCMKNASDYV